jgi:hypothetical protein
MPSVRRFPPPWSVDEQEACFIVRDANRQALTLRLFRGEGAAHRRQHRQAAGAKCSAHH